MNGIRMFRRAGFIAGMLAMTGCATLTPAPVPVSVRENEEIASLKEEVKALQEWRQESRLEQESQAKEIGALRKRVQALESAVRENQQAAKVQFQDLETAREQDKKFIVDELTRKLVTVQSALTPPPPPPPPAGAARSGYEHTVKAGETLSAIAKTYKVSMDAILKANKLKNANAIRIGQKLFIPD